MQCMHHKLAGSTYLYWDSAYIHTQARESGINNIDLSAVHLKILAGVKVIGEENFGE